ncbi:MAG: paraquat-inducible membrane protein A [Alphaproteobacteria bacterium]|nr:MAG: paraquat-inducible membrane protein A [Alphaproteobacteria bacterium]
MSRALRIFNLALLVLVPVAWFAPLLRTGIDLPLFGLTDISIVSGLQALWQTDVLLALLVTFLAIVAPLAKIGGVALVQFGLMRRRVLPVLNALGRWAMADVFLIALYIVVLKGVGMTRVETGWGLYLFTFCVLASLASGHLTARREKR